MRRIVGVLFLVLVVACQNPINESAMRDIAPLATELADSEPTPIVNAPMKWVIFSADHADQLGLGSWLVETDDFWTPTTTDVMMLEEKLPGYLSQNAHAFYR